MKKYAFGVDIGGTTIKLGLFLTEGKLLEGWEIPTSKEHGGKDILPDIAAAIDNKLKELEISKSEVEGIGAGVPGPVASDGTIYKCVNLGWGIFNGAEALSNMTGLKVKVGNDANVAALGEMWQGGGKGCDSLVMVTLGTGVGGGVIINGKILEGFNGAAGELGHITMSDSETETCGCGKKGCLEQYASANGIVKLTERYLSAHPDETTSLRSVSSLTSKEIFDEAKKGDSVALKMVSEVGRLLGKALAAVACVINPEAFVIGGGMSKAGDILINAIKTGYAGYAFHASADTAFRLAKLGNNAGIYGGVRMLLD